MKFSARNLILELFIVGVAPQLHIMPTIASIQMRILDAQINYGKTDLMQFVVLNEQTTHNDLHRLITLWK